MKKIISFMLALMICVCIFMFTLPVLAAGNSIETAQPISLGTNVSGRIAAYLQEDYYSFSLV